MKREFALATKAVILRDDKALLLHRTNEEVMSSRINQKDAWDLPGGGVQFFENSQQGLIREIKEETKLTVSIIKPLDIYDVIHPQLHITIVTYLCCYVGGEVVLSDEHDCFFWLTLKEIVDKNIPKWLFVNYQKAYDEYLTLKKL